MVKKIVSNATSQNFNFPIRVRVDDKNSFIKNVEIPAYALNYEIEFNSEEQFKEWEKIHEAYLNEKTGVIKVGKASGHNLEKQNKELEKNADAKTESDNNKISNNEQSAGVETEVQKMTDDNITKAKRK